MAYTKQLNDSYRIVYTDTGGSVYPDISVFNHTGVYSLIAKHSQPGSTVRIAFQMVAGNGSVNLKQLNEGNYFVEYSELENAIYWNFSFLGKSNSGSSFTAMNTMVTYDKATATYTVTDDDLSGGDTPTPAVYIVKTVDYPLTAQGNNSVSKTLTAYVYSDNHYEVSGFMVNKMSSDTSGTYVAQYQYPYSSFSISTLLVGSFTGNDSGVWNARLVTRFLNSGGYIQGVYKPASTTESVSESQFSIYIRGTYSGSL